MQGEVQVLERVTRLRSLGASIVTHLSLDDRRDLRQRPPGIK